MHYTSTTPTAPVHREVGTSTSESLEIFIGDKALSRLYDINFIDKWEDLYQSCPWASVFQSSSFINSWYEHFSYKYYPIVVTAYKGNTLTGLLTMAVLKIKPKEGKTFIVHAGHGEADIQTWLSHTTNSEHFITGALELILKTFPKTDILLRHIAPSTPTGWASKHPVWSKRCVIESFPRPLVRMKDFSLSKRERKRVNRLMEIASFEAIPDTQTFEAYLDEIGVLYDFRHGAMFNRTPFMKEPAYRKLLISLFERQLLAVTVLRNDEKIIASIATTIGRNKAHLGAIICHCPMYACHSPGIVQFLLTSQYFAELGLEYFDLTPGGDAYKARLATEYDVVNSIVITNNKRFFMWRNFRKYTQENLEKVGINPIALKVYLRRQRYLVREKGLKKLWQNSQFSAKQVTEVYKLVWGNKLGAEEHVRIHVNALQHILLYQSNDGKLSRWEFMETAMKRLEAGYTAYTMADNNKLFCCVWLKPNQSEAKTVADAPAVHSLAILSDLHIHPSALQNEEAFLASVIETVVGKDSKKQVYLELDKKRAYKGILLEKTLPAPGS